MFKVGDVVKCIDPGHPDSGLIKGWLYVVKRVGVDADGQFVTVLTDDNIEKQFLSTRFEPTNKPNTLADFSDQQLADDFRTTHRRYLELFDELIKRGYAITFWRGTHYSPPLKRRFSKAGEFPKIKIEKEKKEIIAL